MQAKVQEGQSPPPEARCVHIVRRVLGAPWHVLRAVLTHRFLFRQMTRRSFASKYAGSLLGHSWSLISTGLQLALYWVVFAMIFGMDGTRIAGAQDVSFGLYLITGLVPFLALSEATTRASTLFRSHATLVQRARFPVEVLVLSDIAGTLGRYGLGFLVVVAVCLVCGTVSAGSLLWSALGLLLLVVWVVGLAIGVSVLGAIVPDTAEVLGLALLVLFYGAPIVYPLNLVPEGTLRTLVSINPLAGLVLLIRAGLIGTPVPPPLVILALVSGGTLLLVAAAAPIRRFRMRIADLI